MTILIKILEWLTRKTNILLSVGASLILYGNHINSVAYANMGVGIFISAIFYITTVDYDD
jgi:hypothetical protein